MLLGVGSLLKSRYSKAHQTYMNSRRSLILNFNQCWGFLAFWFGSGCGPGSSDLYLWVTDPDADPGAQKRYGSYGSGSGFRSGCGFGTLGTFTFFFKEKKSKKLHNSRNQSFSYYFCLMMEGYPVCSLCKTPLRIFGAVMVPLERGRQRMLGEGPEESKGNDVRPGIQELWKALQRTGTHNVRRAQAPAGHAAGPQDPGWQWHRKHGLKWQVMWKEWPEQQWIHWTAPKIEKKLLFTESAGNLE